MGSQASADRPKSKKEEKVARKREKAAAKAAAHIVPEKLEPDPEPVPVPVPARELTVEQKAVLDLAPFDHIGWARTQGAHSDSDVGDSGAPHVLRNPDYPARPGSGCSAHSSGTRDAGGQSARSTTSFGTVKSDGSSRIVSFSPRAEPSSQPAPAPEPSTSSTASSGTFNHAQGGTWNDNEESQDRSQALALDLRALDRSLAMTEGTASLSASSKASTAGASSRGSRRSHARGESDTYRSGRSYGDSTGRSHFSDDAASHTSDESSYVSEGPKTEEEKARLRADLKNRFMSQISGGGGGGGAIGPTSAYGASAEKNTNSNTMLLAGGTRGAVAAHQQHTAMKSDQGGLGGQSPNPRRARRGVASQEIVAGSSQLSPNASPDRLPGGTGTEADVRDPRTTSSWGARDREPQTGSAGSMDSGTGLGLVASQSTGSLQNSGRARRPSQYRTGSRTDSADDVGSGGGDGTGWYTQRSDYTEASARSGLMKGASSARGEIDNPRARQSHNGGVVDSQQGSHMHTGRSAYSDYSQSTAGGGSSALTGRSGLSSAASNASNASNASSASAYSGPTRGAAGRARDSDYAAFSQAKEGSGK